jgi:hypothetical protein
MKNLIWKYLDELYPNAYKKLTKFGFVAVDIQGEPISLFKSCKGLAAMFCCNENILISDVDEWAQSRPNVKPLDVSTREDVLVFNEEKSPTTVIL